MNKVVCMGESLIDFLQVKGSMDFRANAGGAPSNVCACVSKLGGQGCYLGKLSNDVFSRFLLETMHKFGVDTRYTVIDDRYPTALAFVSLNDEGDRQFNFYRKETCDLMFSEEDVKDDMLEAGDILHFCSLGLVDAPTKKAHRRAIDIAKRVGATVSFDVNLRLNLWDSVESCVKAVFEFLPYADILKVTDEELVVLTGLEDEKKGVQILLDEAKDCKIVILTKGKDGAIIYDREMNSYSSPAADVKVVDTTGAGDCFIGSILYNLMCGGATLTIDGLKDAVEFASTACGIIVSRAGAMASMPTLEEVNNAR